MDKSIVDSYIQAGKIGKQVLTYTKSLCKEGTSYYEIVSKGEAKIRELGADLAFPINFSVNEFAAHDTPLFHDERTLKKGDLVKVDVGVQINGYIADTASSVSVGKDKENEQLISEAESALNSAIKRLKKDITLGEVGEAISSGLKDARVIRNLTGHGLGQYIIHEGLTIPNFKTEDKKKLNDVAIAIEPFTTFGDGYVVEGKESGIYSLITKKSIRTGREVLEYIYNKYKTLPFSERELLEKFGLKAKLALREMINSRILHQYPTLRERSKRKVAQAEHTILILDKIIVTTA